LGYSKFGKTVEKNSRISRVAIAQRIEEKDCDGLSMVMKPML
jgi:hypothetical protein